MREKGRLGRLLKAAGSEPPRVRAMLGAIGEQIGIGKTVLAQLKASLNPFSRFDFGMLSGLKFAERLAGEGAQMRMKLFEHKDFDQAVLGAERHFQSRGLRPAIIEKDYYVTEGLRIIAQAAGDKIIFKGGTSLAKGWNLIERFSEDLDIFLDPLAFAPALTKNGINRELKKLRDAVVRHPALIYMPSESKTIGGFGRSDYFSYEQRFGGVGTGEIANRVLVEAGTASGREPTETVECVPTSRNSCKRRTNRSMPRTKMDSPCDCFTSAAPSSRSSLPSTPRSSCSSATGGALALTRATTMTSTNWLSGPKSPPCSSRPNTRQLKSTTTQSAELTSPEIIFRPEG